MNRAPLFWVATALLLCAGCASFHNSRLAGAPSGAKFVDAGGVELHYTDRGTGSAVVLIHGYGSSLAIWQQVGDELAKSHRVISIDLKGFGFSGRPAGDYSPAAQAAHTWRALDRIGVRDVAVVGHSWGASVALAMALSSPERVRRIGLYSAYVYEAQVPSFLRWARVGGVGDALFAAFYRERVAERVALAYHDDRFVTAARIDHVEAELSRPGAVAAALATARGQHYAAVERRYRTIGQPVLILWGQDDRVTPIHFARRLAGDLPRATLVELPSCGHIPMVEARARTTRALAAFLAEDRK